MPPPLLQIIFLEDPLAEDDWEGFSQITSEIGKEYEVSGGAGAGFEASGVCSAACNAACSTHSKRSRAMQP